jgi:hypothetical protein
MGKLQVKKDLYRVTLVLKDSVKMQRTKTAFRVGMAILVMMENLARHVIMVFFSQRLELLVVKSAIM